MRATLLFRISSVIFIIFALGHTFGFLSFKPATADGMAVRQAMNDVVFKFNGSELSYGKFYRGFGLSCTVSMLFLSVLCWQMGTMAAVRPQDLVVTAWALVGMQVLGLVFSLKYFGLPPTICSAALTALLGWAALLVTRAG